ncbi:hypothetical protein D3C73_862880 [compost metagenome]
MILSQLNDTCFINAISTAIPDMANNQQLGGSNDRYDRRTHPMVIFPLGGKFIYLFIGDFDRFTQELFTSFNRHLGTQRLQARLNHFNCHLTSDITSLVSTHPISYNS